MPSVYPIPVSPAPENELWLYDSVERVDAIACKNQQTLDQMIHSFCFRKFSSQVAITDLASSEQRALLAVTVASKLYLHNRATLIFNQNFSFTIANGRVSLVPRNTYKEDFRVSKKLENFQLLSYQRVQVLLFVLFFAQVVVQQELTWANFETIVRAQSEPVCNYLYQFAICESPEMLFQEIAVAMHVAPDST